MNEDKYKYLPKFYDLETLTQEDLNKLALERNTLVKENNRLNNIINEAKKIFEDNYYKENTSNIDDQIFFGTKNNISGLMYEKLKEGK